MKALKVGKKTKIKDTPASGRGGERSTTMENLLRLVIRFSYCVPICWRGTSVKERTVEGRELETFLNS
jgi:hypothetical protein